MIAPDPTHGAFILASADTTNGVTTLQSISATSPYTSTTITSASALPVGFLASGILVSDDGSKIYLAGFNASSAPDPANILFIDIANH
jgi:DNA-binding beta-propeller fold protein YncE